MTFVFDKLDDLDRRLNEIDILLTQAAINQNNIDIYNVLCRSATVLLVAHFEGSLKDFGQAFLDDYNSKDIFRNAKIPIKRTFCEYFMEPSDKGTYNESLKDKLITYFDQVNINLNVDPFVPDYGNPSPHHIETIAKKFGINNFFAQLGGSTLNIVFEQNMSNILVLKNDLRSEINTNINQFPYQINFNRFNIYDNARFKGTTLWHDFIDNLLKKRHDVAHGTVISNTINHTDLELSKLKIEILMYGYIIILSRYI